ncbi:MAG: 1-deoxy-D-xylulose-5-phosphate synthase, partial [Leucobacter sp.]|nr:1-deoxy-D-xylulose-5-phosphate synthase [Leucobacter sp.]
SRIVALTAAMLAPTGLAPFATEFADRVQDVGIAEQHAVTSAAGLAYGGLHPVVAVYATFMNRAIDQFIMDVALHRAPVTLVLDRAGITGPDGASHNGVWDLAMLRVVPTVRIAAPRDEPTLRALLGEAVCEGGGPTVVRFPKGSVGEPIVALRTLEDGVDVLWESVIGTADGSGTAAAPPRRVLLVSAGPLARAAVEAASRLTEQGIGVTVVDPRWVIPIADSVVELARQHDLVVSLEDGVRAGGVGTSLSQALSVAGVDRPVVILGVPDGFLAHASRDELLTQCGLAPTEIVRTVLDRLAAVAN